MKIEKNHIVVEEKTLEVLWNIEEALLIEDKLLVVFEISEENEYDNLYCYNLNGQQIWRIDTKLPYNAGNKKEPFVGVTKTEEGIRVIDYVGRSFIIDINNATLSSVKIVK